MELQTPELVAVNRLPMRAHSFAYENLDLAQNNIKENSSRFFSLNGQWKFNWVQDPYQRPEGFQEVAFDDSRWQNFTVPSSWEVNGYGLPIYVNHPYDFAGHNLRGAKMNPPYDIPAHNNPVGSYRKKFDLPEGFKNKNVTLHIGNAKSCVFVWVNGKKVGYSEDSKLEAEFDITPYLVTGQNLIALQIYRWSDGSYLECQDMFRFSGIDRDVYLFATEKLNIRDIKIDATLDDNFQSGLLNIDAEIFNNKSERGTLSRKDSFTVEAVLKDRNNNVVFEKNSGIETVLGRYKSIAHFSATLPAVKAWNAEQPYLYTLYLTLKNVKGEVVDVIPQRVGFKKIEIKGTDFLVNGKRVFFKGVNRHEHHPRKGHTLSREDMRKDMEMMKKLNVNAVRLSHYPPDSYWLDLCDEYGLYVVDEANIESHGLGYDLGVSIANKPLWKEAHLQRILRMYERDKNHPSIITWSVGNEAGDGSNFYAGYDLLKSKSKLPVQYERDLDYGSPNGTIFSEVFCPQYYGPESMEAYAKSNARLVHIQSEYAHIMGNSLGNFKDFWDVIENNPKLQGGYIWEWIDQSIDTVKNGKRIKAYGGDFPLEGPVDENLSDNNFCVKGVVDAYRNMTPMAYEVRKVYQNIKTKWLGGNRIEVRNGYFFRNLDNYQLKWSLLENGLVKESGNIASLNLAPGAAGVYDLPLKYRQNPNDEYLLNVSYVLKTAEPFLSPGYEIAYDQFPLTQAKPGVAVPKGVPVKLHVIETGNIITLSNKNFQVRFDVANGIMHSVEANGTNVLNNGPKPSFWRAPTDNDIGAGFNRNLRMWRNAYDSGTAVKADKKLNEDGSYTISFNRQIVNADAIATQTYTVYGDGRIFVQNAFKAVKGAHKILLRIGNDLVLNGAFKNINWYGRGPVENYWDRKANTIVGQYASQVSEQYYPYARPQESGNRSDVRWVSFSNGKRKVAFEFADSLLNFSAIPYSLDDLDPEVNKRQYHSGELNARPETYVHIDLQQIGLQGVDSWGSWPMKKYQLPFRDYSYSYWIKFE